MILTVPNENGFNQKFSIYNQIQNSFHLNGTQKKWTNKTIDHYIENSNQFFFKDLFGHYGCVNAIEFSRDGKFMVSGGDDKRVIIWNLWEAISGNLILYFGN